jgi:hypothetical protein
MNVDRRSLLWSTQAALGEKASSPRVFFGSRTAPQRIAGLTFQRHDIEYDQPGIGFELCWRR